MIKNIVFDIGMVLADFRWKAYMREDLGFSEELTEFFGDRLVCNEIWAEFDLGVRETDDIIGQMKASVSEYPAEADLFFEHIVDIAQAYPYAKPWVEELKGRGYRVYLLSNYPRDVYRIHEEKKFDFAACVDGKVVSGFERLSKPDPRIYQLLLERYHLKAEESVFLDDREDNIAAALDQGMHGIVFRSYEDARKKLEELLK